MDSTVETSNYLFQSSFNLTVTSEQDKVELPTFDDWPSRPESPETLPEPQSEPGSESTSSYLYVRDWSGPVYESFKEEPFKATAPIPYIIDLSMTGVLRIGWDQKMQNWESTDFTAIQDTKVAVKNWQ